MAINIIVAADENNAIGCHGKMPWHLPGDLRHFRDVTMGHPIIMGRKTWEAIGRLPLAGRLNIVVSHNYYRTNGLSERQREDLVFKPSLYESVFFAQEQNADIFIIGGGSIYEQALPLADRVFLTRVHTEVKDADTFFPVLDPAQWRIVFISRNTLVKHTKMGLVSNIPGTTKYRVSELDRYRAVRIRKQ